MHPQAWKWLNSAIQTLRENFWVLYLHLNEFITMSIATQWQSKLTMSCQSAYGRRQQHPAHHIFRDYFFGCHSMMWILSTWWRRRMSLQMHFPEFHPCHHQARWASEGHDSCPHAHNGNSRWFYNCSTIPKKNYSTRHNIRSTNASSLEWLARVKKGFHPPLLDYWTYREEISAENGLLFKGQRLIILQDFVRELFRPSMKATSVLRRCSWEPKSQYYGQR